MARVLKVDPNSLTLADCEDIEAYCGQSIGEILAPEAPLSAKAMTALAWVVIRRDEPEFRIEDARKLPIAGLEVEAVAPDPTVAADSVS